MRCNIYYPYEQEVPVSKQGWRMYASVHSFVAWALHLWLSLLLLLIAIVEAGTQGIV